MDWLEQVRETLLPLSVEQDDVRKALQEWHYNGDTYDLHPSSTDCELCGHKNIRYQFTIENEETANLLLIGSECIKRFDISATDSSGRRLSREATHAKVNKDRSKLIADSKARRVILALVELSQADNDFDITDLIDYYRDREAFTPNQLQLLMWRLDKHNITHNKTDFKMIIKRDREKQQLKNMEQWKVKKIWGCMTSSQQDYYINNTTK